MSHLNSCPKFRVHFKQIEDIDLFGGAAVVLSAGGVSKAGRPRLPLRLMVSLLYLKHAFNESDEGLVVAADRKLTHLRGMC